MVNIYNRGDGFIENILNIVNVKYVVPAGALLRLCQIMGEKRVVEGEGLLKNIINLAIL